MINANDNIKTNHRTGNISRSIDNCLLLSRNNDDVQNENCNLFFFTLGILVMNCTAC